VTGGMLVLCMLVVNGVRQVACLCRTCGETGGMPVSYMR